METQLRTIPHHHIHMECRFCRYTAEIAYQSAFGKSSMDQPLSVTSFEKLDVKIVIENQNRILD
jgi:hypothetical protein